MQAQKNTRRKRKDQQSRDFTCRCGKSYLSYAAAYTHVKNKHNLQKQFLDDIGKPERQKLPRGRPKERKQAQSSVEIQQLSIVEQAILKIYQLLHNRFERIILEGNSKKNQEEVQEAYQKLIDKKLYASLKPNQKTQLFISQLNKHFNSQISARIKLAVLITAKSINQHSIENGQHGQQVIDQLNSYDLWKGQNTTNTIIYEAFTKWLALSNQ